MRLKGCVWLMVMVRLGKPTVSVESCVRCATFMVAEMLHFDCGKRYVIFTVELLVLSVKALE